MIIFIAYSAQINIRNVNVMHVQSCFYAGEGNAKLTVSTRSDFEPRVVTIRTCGYGKLAKKLSLG